MKKLRRFITQNGIYLASLALISAIVAPLVSLATRPASINEEILVSLSRGMGNVMTLRWVVLGIILINTTIIYCLLSSWLGKRRAGLSAIVLACMPVWLLMQVAIPRFAGLLMPVLLALWAFDKAGRSDRAAGWYLLAGIAVTAGWLQDPMGVTIVMVLCSLLLIGIKPRYAKHITRQASLVLIILATTVAALSAASWRFGLGVQDYLIRQLSGSVQLGVPHLYLDGPTNYHLGLPGVTLIPLAIIVLAGLGAWQMVIARQRPRNVYLLVLPLLLAAIAPQCTGLTALLLLSLAMLGFAVWTVMGIQYLHNSWKRVFPHNRLANNVGDLLIVLMVGSLALYSFWFIVKGWNGNPQARIDAAIEWDGQL